MGAKLLYLPGGRRVQLDNDSITIGDAQNGPKQWLAGQYENPEFRKHCRTSPKKRDSDSATAVANIRVTTARGWMPGKSSMVAS
jgi:hypothetical protein